MVPSLQGRWIKVDSHQVPKIYFEYFIGRLTIQVNAVRDVSHKSQPSYQGTTRRISYKTYDFFSLTMGDFTSFLKLIRHLTTVQTWLMQSKYSWNNGELKAYFSQTYGGYSPNLFEHQCAYSRRSSRRTEPIVRGNSPLSGLSCMRSKFSL